MKCPHCNKQPDSNTDIAKYISLAHRNVESYGSSFFTLRCPHCKKKFTFYIEVITSLGSISKANKERCLSWGT